MRTLEIGLGAIFFLIGLILALSKSAKGATVLTVLLGIIGGGGGIIFGQGHIPFVPKDASPEQQASSAGAILIAIAGGAILGLAVVIISKAVGRKRGVDIGINVAQPDVDANSKL